MKSYKEFISSRPKPSLDRTKDKYYPEIQQLSYNLVRYLSMNEDPNEHSCQGNYNLTYLIENLTDYDFKKLVGLFIRRIPLGELKELITNNIGSNYGDTIVQSFEEKASELKIDLTDDEKFLIEVKLTNDTYEWFTARDDKNLLERITDIKESYEVKKLTLYERKFEVR